MKQQIKQALDPSQKYLFYMHGTWIENHGLQEPHPRFGKYEYDKIVQSLSEKKFTVISEARSTNVNRTSYARKVANQANKLIQQGVPAENLFIVGHSKGGYMSLVASTILANSKINYVIMAGCGKEGTTFSERYMEFVQGNASRLKGRILSIYDKDDDIAGTCVESFDKATGLISKEIVLYTGKGHGLFYAPEKIWIDEIAKWSGQ